MKYALAGLYVIVPLLSSSAYADKLIDDAFVNKAISVAAGECKNECALQFKDNGKITFNRVRISPGGPASAYLVTDARELCGSAGCPTLLLVPSGGGYSEALQGFGLSLESEVSNGRLQLTSDNGRARYVWNGVQFDRAATAQRQPAATGLSESTRPPGGTPTGLGFRLARGINPATPPVIERPTEIAVVIPGFGWVVVDTQIIEDPTSGNSPSGRLRPGVYVDSESSSECILISGALGNSTCIDSDPRMHRRLLSIPKKQGYAPTAFLVDWKQSNGSLESVRVFKVRNDSDSLQEVTVGSRRALLKRLDSIPAIRQMSANSGRILVATSAKPVAIGQRVRDSAGNWQWVTSFNYPMGNLIFLDAASCKSQLCKLAWQPNLTVLPGQSLKIASIFGKLHLQRLQQADVIDNYGQASVVFSNTTDTGVPLAHIASGYPVVLIEGPSGFPGWRSVLGGGFIQEQRLVR